MSRGPLPANLAASVRARLHNLARQRRVEFQLILAEFGIERLLYRLGISEFADRFVLKGAMLFKLWTDERRRATWDLDLLGRGSNGIADVVAVFRTLIEIPADDAITFLPDSIAAEAIRAEAEVPGVRVRLEARLADARIPLQVDIGFGDAVVPSPTRATYPTLLDHASPRILAYSRNPVVAEKLEAMVSLGVTNSRMKDFYDVHVLASGFAFDGPALAAAIRATFERRATPFPDGDPLVLTRSFLGAPEWQTPWRAFLRRCRLDGPADAGDLADGLRAFLVPALAAAAGGDPFEAAWPAGGPWKAER